MFYITVLLYAIVNNDVVGTFKLKKTDYKKAGFDPSKVQDKMYYLDGKQGQYTEINQQVYDAITSGKIRI